MPKERRSRSVSFDRASPLPSRSSSRRRNSPLPSSSRNPPRSPRPAANDVKEWDETRCPVCMDHPHNAVLLHCTSHEKGCRPFMCDTSYRHSNCLDQYRKALDVSMDETPEASKPRLSCPLCRGIVSGWKVVEAARKHMNAKARSCSTESCGFMGAYSEIRKHARTEHPLIRPSETDPGRQRDWRRLEQQRDLGDLFSTMQSVLGGEDDGLTFLADGGEFGSLIPLPSITLFLVLRFRGTGGLGSSTGWSSARRGSSRSSSPPSSVNFSVASCMAPVHALGVSCVLWKAGMVLRIVLNFIGLAKGENGAGASYCVWPWYFTQTIWAGFGWSLFWMVDLILQCL
ncbi:hypothetical protein KSP40_PGU006714 [Platanthera guangdongensis]|uniref:Uncharacterized protein n=1 Tax=Platanthera guangdongensis TaxID=2320717 RepID=A0ABR2MHC7_9ASPA